MFSFLFNPFFILPMILVAWAQMRVRSAFKKYSQVASAAQLSGAETARRILHQQRIYDVSVEETSGMLSDHYDPRAKAVRLSSDNFHGHHLAGLAVAAHEVGHAIQHAHGYVPLNFSARDPARRQLGLVAGLPPHSGGNVLRGHRPDEYRHHVLRWRGPVPTRHPAGGVQRQLRGPWPSSRRAT